MSKYHIYHRSFLALSMSTILAGCQVINMIDVKKVDFSKTANHERQSILTNQKLSQSSTNILLAVQPKVEYCIQNADECMHKLNTIDEISDENKLSTGSELYLSYAFNLKNSAACQNIDSHVPQNISTPTTLYQQCIQNYLEALNQSIRYSYAYLFATQRQPQQRLFNNRQIQVKDFYNQAIAQLVNMSNEVDKSNILTQNITIGQSVYDLDFTHYPDLELKNIEQLISTDQLEFIGLNSLSRRDGFGSEFAIKIKTNHNADTVVDYGTEKINIFQHENVRQAEYLPATVVIEPEDTRSIEHILKHKKMRLRLFNPNLHDEVKITQHHFQLAANFSAPYGLWLANAKLGSQGLNTLLNKDKQFISPKLFMLEPYNPHKKLIIMIHGLASSPEAWISVSNDLMADKKLRDQYQIWQVFYSTNLPILENRYQIYHLLHQSLQQIQQKHPQQPIQDTLLIGHSMGGVISRLLVSDHQLDDVAKHYLKTHCYSCKNQALDVDRFIDDLRPKLNMQPLPTVSRAVFISAPFRGTVFADRWFTKAMRRAIKIPLDVLQNNQNRFRSYLRNTEQHMNNQVFDELYENGASALSPKSVFMTLTKDVNVISSLPYHVITGNNTKSEDKTKITDGIVPYSSVHLEGALSEKVIAGSHSIQYSPEALLELRRILFLHLEESRSRTTIKSQP